MLFVLVFACAPSVCIGVVANREAVAVTVDGDLVEWVGPGDAVEVCFATDEYVEVAAVEPVP